MKPIQVITPVYLDNLRVYPFNDVHELICYVQDRKGILVAVNAEKMINAGNELAEIINTNIGYCDGGGAVLACKQQGVEARRIPGCELWLEIVSELHADSTFYFVGSTQEVIEATVNKIGALYPGIKISGWRNGFINSDEEREKLISEISELRPDVVFVAMGSPRQEILMGDMMKVHKAIYQGLGGSFDVFVGKQKRAPLWWQRHNCEFLYRLLIRPRRLFRNTAQLKLAMRLMRKKYVKRQ